MTRIKRSFVLFLVTMTLGATYGGGCSLLGRRMEEPKVVRMIELAE
jgi:hypothetical protein